MTVQREGNRFAIRLSDGRSLALAPQECWDAAVESRRLLVENAAGFSPPVVASVRKNGREFRVAVSRNIDFWHRLEHGMWEPETFGLFDRFIAEDCTYFDAGAWIGPTLLYAAQRARRAYAFEPDPVAFRELAANLACNAGAAWASRVALVNKAVTARGGTARLGSRGAFGDALSSVLFADQALAREVEAVSLEELLTQPDTLRGEVFLKMDIEGAEYEAIPRLRRALSREGTHLFLSLHPVCLMHGLRAAEGGDSLRGKLRRRLAFTRRHLALVRSLPFRRFYYCDGRPVDLRRQILRAFSSGDFVSAIFATNREWGAA